MKIIRKLKKAVWFAGYQPSEIQIESAFHMGYEISFTEEGNALYLFDIQIDRDLFVCVSALLGHCANIGAVAIFGEFKTPLFWFMNHVAEDIWLRGKIVPPEGGRGDYPCFASWNISTFQENEKPILKYKEWVLVGRLNQDACQHLYY